MNDPKRKTDMIHGELMTGIGEDKKNANKFLYY
jgi:hypothetical protein